uniref:Peptidylprolyl isomerase n=1 Tax=Panagrolaimus sp. PS1159 TaxID=55785 RepID=A0AC35GVN4_9BILA
MSDDDYESVSVAQRRAASSGEPSLAGSGDEERALSDTEIPKVQKTKELASQLKGPSSNELETECEKSRIQAAKDELEKEQKSSDEYVTVDNEGFEDILGGGDLWKKTIKEGSGERGAASQWAEIRVKDLNDPNSDVTEVQFPLGYHYILDAWELAVQLMLPGEICIIKKVQFPLGYHYILDAWELAVQLMLPGEICIIKSTPRFIDGSLDSKELSYKYEIELTNLGKFVDFDDMSEEQTIEFLKILNNRGDYYFAREMIEHALQLNIKALDIITKELEDAKELHGVKLNLLISAAHYYWKLKNANEGMRVIRDGLEIDPANEKLLYKQSQFHFLKKEFKECTAILKKLVAMGIESEAINQELRKAEIGVKEQLEKEKQVYKRMLGALGKPPRKEQQQRNNGFNPTKRYLYMAGTVCLFAILFQVIRHFLNIHYF